LEKQANRDFQQEAWHGKVQYQRSADLRYRGQGYELNVPFTGNLLTQFQHEHLRRYGYAHTSREMEIVTLRLRAVVKSPPLRTIRSDKRAKSRDPGQAKLGSPFTPKVQVMFDHKKLSTAIYPRDNLRAGRKYPGPAVVCEYSATTVVPPAGRFHVDPAGNLIVKIR
jgi:N-methylhydantoinase A